MIESGRRKEMYDEEGERERERGKKVVHEEKRVMDRKRVGEKERTVKIQREREREREEQI